MLGLFDIFLVFVLKFNVLLDLVFDQLMLLGKCLLKTIYSILLQVEVVTHPRVLILIAFELSSENSVLFAHLVYERFGF